MSLENRYISLTKRIKSLEINQQKVDLLAVSKKHSIEKIKALFQLGQIKFGESYIQEAVEKIKQLEDLAIQWHFIGPIQSNKTKFIAQNFDWVQSVDSHKILTRLNNQRQGHKNKLNILLQLKVGGEITKRGFNSKELLKICTIADTFENLSFRGLMSIPAPSTNYKQQYQQFAQCHKVFQQMQKSIPKADTLSMGMSADLEAAIASQSTMVRIGTDIFGVR